MKDDFYIFYPVNSRDRPFRYWSGYAPNMAVACRKASLALDLPFAFELRFEGPLRPGDCTRRALAN
jgi:hypothetical protein